MLTFSIVAAYETPEDERNLLLERRVVFFTH